MRRHAKASSAGSSDGSGSSRGLFRRAFITRGASRDFKGSGAPSPRLLLAASLSLLAFFTLASSALAAPPTVTIDSSVTAGYTTAKVKGTIDTGGREGFYEFETSSDGGANWNVNFGGYVPSVPGTLEPTFEFNGLQPSTQYMIRLSVFLFEDGSTTYSPEPSPTFTTLGPVTAPLAEANDATAVTGTGAHFSGKVTAKSGPAQDDPGFSANCTFDYVKDAQFQVDGFTSAQGAGCAPENPVAGFGAVNVEADVADLEPHTTYHLRLRAENLGGTATDAAASFLTEAIAPSIPGTSVSDIEDDSATVHAEINPGGDPTTYHFEYMTLAAYEAAGKTFTGASATPESASIGADTANHAVAASLTGLQPDTAYRFRAVAKNAKSPVGGSAGPARALRTHAVSSEAPESCPNAAVRLQQGATFLPECRAYEIADRPGLDEGEANRVPSVTDDGETLVYSGVVPGDESFGGAVSSLSVARRGPGGWTQQSADPLSVGSGTGLSITSFIGASADYTKVLVGTSLPLNSEDEDNQTDYYVVDVGKGTTTWITRDALGTPYRPVGASLSLGRIVYQAVNTGEGGVYANDGSGKDLLSVDEHGNAFEFPALAGSNAEFTPWHNVANTPFVNRGGIHAVSDDAQRVYFGSAGNPFNAHNPFASLEVLYLNDHGTAIPISASQRAADLGTTYPAEFVSASHDGSTVLFTSLARLTEAAPPGGGIYRYDIDTKAMTLLIPAGDPEGLQLGPDGHGIITSDDQTHIYFSSPLSLAPGAAAGENNAYAWTAAGGLRFVATLGNGDSFVRVTRNGDYALIGTIDNFGNSNATLSSLDGAPNNGHKAFYEYDFASQQLACVTCRADGSLSQGDAQIEGQSVGAPNNAQAHNRALTSDGRVVFASRDRLVPGDQTAAQDVYVYNHGKISLLSSGREESDSFVADVSDNGDHAFIVTRAALVGADHDPGEYDVYDVAARGGFLEPPPPPAGCEGEACRTAAPGAPSAVNPGTSAFAGPGNPKPCPKGKVRRNARCVKPRKSAKRHNGKHGQKRGHKRNANGNGRTGR